MKGAKALVGEGCTPLPVPGSAKVPGSPRRKLIACVAPPRSTSTSRRADSALTTLAPTPWRPPEAA